MTTQTTLKWCHFDLARLLLYLVLQVPTVFMARSWCHNDLLGEVMRVLMALILTGAMILLSGFLANASAPDGACYLSSSGLFQGQWVKHRILSHEQVLFGANDMESVRSELHSLRERGLCR